MEVESDPAIDRAIKVCLHKRALEKYAPTDAELRGKFNARFQHGVKLS